MKHKQKHMETVTKQFSLISNGVIMFKDELKNWKWAAIPVFTIIKKKSYNSLVRVFTAQPKQAKKSQSVTEQDLGLTSVRIRRKHTLPPLRLISWAFGGRQSGMDPTGHIIAEKELEWMYWALLDISEGLSNRMSGKCKSWSAAAAAGEEWDIIKWSCNLWMCNLPRTNI